MLKKIIFILLLIIICSTTGATCGCNGSSGIKDSEKITLTIWHVFDDESVLKPILDLYQQLNPNIAINYVKKDFAEYEKQTLDALAAGKGPDIWMIRNDWVYKHTDKLVPMTKKLFIKSDNDVRSDVKIYEDMFPEIAVKNNIIDNNIYGIPLSIDTLALYYNVDHFKEITNKLLIENNKDSELFYYPPNDWEQFLKISKLLTQKDDKGNITRSGAALGTANNIDNASDILAILMIQNSTQMNSADLLTATFNLPVTKGTGEPAYTGTEALNFYTSFADPAKENYMWNTSMSNSLEAFMQGRTSMMINYGYARERISQEVPNLNYKIGPLPQIAGSLTSVDYASYWVETVTNNSQNPKEAWKLIKFLYDNSAEYNTATQKPFAKKISEITLPQTKQRNIIGGDPFIYQPMSAKYWYKGNYPTKVDAAFSDMISDVTVNKEPYQKSIDKAALVVTQLYKLTFDERSVTVVTPATTAK